MTDMIGAARAQIQNLGCDQFGTELESRCRTCGRRGRHGYCPACLRRAARVSED